MEDEAYFIVDNNGVEMALGGLNATLRDYAKFGLLYANRGRWNGEVIVPSSWVDASHQTDAPIYYQENMSFHLHHGDMAFNGGCLDFLIQTLLHRDLQPVHICRPN